MVGYGRTWWDMVGYGRTWWEMVGYGKIWWDTVHMVRYGRLYCGINRIW